MLPELPLPLDPEPELEAEPDPEFDVDPDPFEADPPDALLLPELVDDDPAFDALDPEPEPDEDEPELELPLADPDPVDPEPFGAAELVGLNDAEPVWLALCIAPPPQPAKTRRERDEAKRVAIRAVRVTATTEFIGALAGFFLPGRVVGCADSFPFGELSCPMHFYSVLMLVFDTSGKIPRCDYHRKMASPDTPCLNLLLRVTALESKIANALEGPLAALHGLGFTELVALTYVATHDSVSLAELAIELGESRVRVFKLISSLQRRALVTRDGTLISITSAATTLLNDARATAEELAQTMFSAEDASRLGSALDSITVRAPNLSWCKLSH